MKYKIGDKLICKNITGDHWINKAFKKNHQYEIAYVGDDDTVFITVQDKVGVWFQIKQEDKLWYIEHYLNNYFYTKQEARKLKLEKLNERRL